MSWALSSTGRVIDHSNPLATAGRLTVGEIAHSLATINRFTGHALRPISVAEHSLLVADIVEQVLGLGVHAQMASLMHDAHEVACGDVATPTKRQVAPLWDVFEREWEHAFHKAFGLCEAFHVHGADIKRADLIALATERRDLMHPGGPPWASLAGIEPLASVNLRSRDSFTWQDWRTAFEDRHAELTYAITHYTRKATA
jgi:uncharacterized protein